MALCRAFGGDACVAMQSGLSLQWPILGSATRLQDRKGCSLAAGVHVKVVHDAPPSVQALLSLMQGTGGHVLCIPLGLGLAVDLVEEEAFGKGLPRACRDCCKACIRFVRWHDEHGGPCIVTCPHMAAMQIHHLACVGLLGAAQSPQQVLEA